LAGVGSLSPAGVFLVSYAGVIIGDNFGFAVGFLARFSSRVDAFVGRLERRVDIENRRNSYWLVFFQFPVIIRAPTPILLGASRMNFFRWLALDLVASLMFVSALFACGYISGRLTGDLGTASQSAAVLQLSFVFLLVAWSLFAGLKYLLARRNSKQR
jgi:membrane protein DedA with SNARE-associated domain